MAILLIQSLFRQVINYFRHWLKIKFFFHLRAEVEGPAANVNVKYLRVADLFYQPRNLILIQKKKRMDGDCLVRLQLKTILKLQFLKRFLELKSGSVKLFLMTMSQLLLRSLCLNFQKAKRLILKQAAMCN